MALTTATDWHPTACILCECNCGIAGTPHHKHVPARLEPLPVP